eukprot:Awhi_evm2s4744
MKSLNLLLTLVAPSGQAFKFVATSKKNVHLHCTGDKSTIYNVADFQACASETVGQTYNGFTYSPSLKMCTVQTCLNFSYETSASLYGFISYVDITLHPGLSMGYKLAHKSNSTLVCQGDVQLSNIFNGIVSVEACLEAGSRHSNPLLRYEPSTGACEIVSCHPDIYVWDNEYLKKVITYVKDDIDYGRYSTGGCVDSYDLGSFPELNSTLLCAEKCNEVENCVSFIYSKTENNVCSLSSTCTVELSEKNQNSEEFLYVKEPEKTEVAEERRKVSMVVTEGRRSETYNNAETYLFRYGEPDITPPVTYTLDECIYA